MELSKFKPTESKELSLIDSIDENIFLEITEIINNCFKKIGIRLENKVIYYQRYSNHTSILAIKVSDGDDNDIANYMFNGCDATYFSNQLSCDVYLHAEAKSAQPSVKIANMISKDIVNFFNTLEGELALKGLRETELFIRIPLSKKEANKKKNEQNKLQRLLKTIFHNK